MAIRFLDEEQPQGGVRFLDEDVEESLEIEPAGLERPLTALATGGISEIARQVPKVAELAQQPTEGATEERQSIDQLITAMAKQFGAEAVNTALLGIPGFAATKAGVPLEEPQTVGEEAAARTGEALGFVAGAPGQIFRGVSAATRGLPPAISAGLGAAATGLAEVGAEDIEAGGDIGQITEDFLQIEQRGKRAAIRGLLTTGTVLAGQLIRVGAKAIASPKQVARNVKNFFDQPQLAENVRREFKLIGRKASRVFRNSLRKIDTASDKTMNLEDVTNKLLRKGIVKNRKALSALKRSELYEQTLNELFDKPELARKMTVIESQEFINSLESKISLSKLSGRGIRPDEVNLLKLLKEVKRGQAKVWPEMRGVRREYGKVIGPFRELQSQTKFGKLLTNMKNRKSLWNDKEAQKFIRDNMSQQTIKDIGGFKAINNILKTVGIIGGAVAVRQAIKTAQQPVEQVFPTQFRE